MRVVFINRYFFPDHAATSQLTSDLAVRLAATGESVSVITSRQLYSDPSANLPVFEIVEGVAVHRVVTTRFGRSGLVGRAIDYATFYLSASWRLFWSIDRDTTVVSMTDPPMIGVPASIVIWFRRARLVNWLQDVFPEVAERLHVLKPGLVSWTLKKIRNASLRHASLNVAIGERMADLVEAEIGRRPAVIPNWALAEQSDGGDAARNLLREQWRLEGKFVVGYSGNMGRAHQLDVLVEAASQLGDRADIVFLLIGDGAQRDALIARASALGLTNVMFQPYQPREKLRMSLTVPDIHVVSLDEQLEGLIVPSKFVGVIAMGRPVLFLGSATGEIGRLIAETGCGAVVSTLNPSAVAGMVRSLADDASRRASMRQAATELWAARFRRERALQMWRELLDQR